VRLALVLGAVAAAALVASACQAAPTDPGGPGDTTTTTSTTPPGPDRPVIGSTFVDTPTADVPATGIVGFAGGTIEGTTAEGITYSLSVPPGALGDPTEITVQPLERLGPPFGDDTLVAFDLQPEGLTFSRPALLLASLPNPVSGEVVGIGAFGDDGQGFHRASATFEQLLGIDNVIAIEVTHFSSARAEQVTPGEKAAWTVELENSFTPSAELTAFGHRYAEAVRAKNAAIAGSAGPLDVTILAANLQAWLDDRIEGQLLAVGGRDRLVQAVAELDQVSGDAQLLPDGPERDAISVEIAATDELVRQAWLAVFNTYLAPDCSAPLLDASDAILHPSHIASIAESHSWSGFALPQDDSGWCLRIQIEELDVPPTVPDEEQASSATTVPMTMRYAMRTPRAPAFAGEPMAARFDDGFVRLAEREDEAEACLFVTDLSGTIPAVADTSVCTAIPHGEDTVTFDVDPTGLADLKVEARVELESLRDLFKVPTRSATSPRQQRTLTLTTPSAILPSPPHVAPVCALVEEVADAHIGPVEGANVTLAMVADPGSTASFTEVTGQTGPDGRLCADYSYNELADPTPGSSVVFDVVGASWTDHLGRPRSTPLVLEPDWVDVRLWDVADGRSFTDRIDDAAPTTYAFSGSRFSSWQAALVRRAASPEQPDRTGARAITPDGGTSGTIEGGGGIVVDSSTSAVNVGGYDTSPVGIDLQGSDQPTPAFRLCVCREPATAPGDGQLTFSADVDGRVVSHDLLVSWPQLVTPPPPPPPPPTPDPDGVTRTTVYAPERSFDSGTYRYDGAIQNVTQRTSGGVLVFEQAIAVDGVAVLCPRTDIVGSFESYCGSFTGSVDDVSWTISGGTSVITFADAPRSFVLRLTIGALDGDGAWVEQVFEITIVPGDEPPPEGGGGSEDFTIFDTCRATQDWVHDRREGGGGCDCA